MPFDSLEGVAMHYVNSKDEAHRELESKYQIKQQADSTDKQTDTDRQTDTDYDLPDFNSMDSSDDCCNDPEIEGDEGDTFRLNNGEIIRLENNEQICLNCERIL